MEHVEEALSLSPTEIDALADDIAVTAAHIDAATHRLLTLIREFDRAGGWYRQGALSCAHWLSWRIGLGLGPAREKVRVAHKLAELPLLDEAFRRGELSYSKLRAMTRVASPDNEAALLDLARNSTAAQLERMCRLYRQAHPPERPSPRDQDDRRWVVTRPTDDGMVAIQIRLNAEEAARLMRAIEHCADRGSLADGAVALADSGLAGVSGTDGPIRPPVEVVVHVAAATLEGHTDLGDGLSSETCRRLLCDAGVVPMVEDAAGKTIDVGRKTRTIPAALRRALEARDQTCRFPGCSHRRFLDAHHAIHWIDGGETKLSNALLTCRRHPPCSGSLCVCVCNTRPGSKSRGDRGGQVARLLAATAARATCPRRGPQATGLAATPERADAPPTAPFSRSPRSPRHTHRNRPATRPTPGRPFPRRSRSPSPCSRRVPTPPRPRGPPAAPER